MVSVGRLPIRNAMIYGKSGSFVTISAVVLLGLSHLAVASNGQPNPTPTPTPAGPAAPALVSPASGASLVQPITLDWKAVSNPNGPIGSYTWQVATTSTFTTIIVSGFTDMDPDSSVPTPTSDKV